MPGATSLPQSYFVTLDSMPAAPFQVAVIADAILQVQ
jgi:hypothetical protein